MTLPALDIPLALPFEIPLLMHPISVHFAIALPVLILLLEFSNLAFKRRALSVTSMMFMILVVVVYFAAFLTGKTDGSEAGPLLSSMGQEELKEHKLIGTYLVYASIVLLAFKAFSMLIARGWAKGLFFLVLILFIAGSFKQGKDGGELVYEYGANVKLVSEHEDVIDELNDELSELKETHAQEIETLQEKLSDANKTIQESLAKVVEQSYDKAVEATKEMSETLSEHVSATVESITQSEPEAPVADVENEVTQDAAADVGHEVTQNTAADAEIPRGTIATH
jgi:uncharacterized membrane protein